MRTVMSWPRALPGLIALALAPQVAAAAGALYGTVLRNGQPAGDVSIELACPGFSPSRPVSASAALDRSGAFTIFPPPGSVGSCELRARQGTGVGTPIEVFVSDSSLKIELAVDAALALRLR